MLKADLHIHSTYSDGTATIEQIIHKALDKELDVIAISDHDTFEHLDHIGQSPEAGRLKIIPALEISAADGRSGRRVHLLGYNIQSPERVEALTQPQLEARHKNTLRQIGILKDHGYEVNVSTLKPAGGKYLYKQHVLEYLLNTGQIPDMFGAFYRETFRNNGICHFDIAYVDACKAVRTIKDAGGQAVLAHAGQQQNFSVIPALVACGLDGLELNHPANSEEDKKILRTYGDSFSLFYTGGSDYHGLYERPEVDVGDYLSEHSGIKALCAGRR